MKFQSEKKELWRYASKNLAAPARGTNRQQPLPHRLQHQRLPQSGRNCSVMMQSTHQPSFLGCCEDFGESSTASTPSSITVSRQANISTPPPPYSSVPESDFSSNAAMPDFCLTFRQHQTYRTDIEMETTVSATLSRNGSNCENTGDIMLVDDCEKSNETSTFSSYQLSVDLLRKARGQKNLSEAQIGVSGTTSPTTSFAATAAKILRNCCGGTFGSSNSVTTTSSNANPNNSNTCSKVNPERGKTGSDQLIENCNNFLPEQYFSTLMKQLKASQISLLLKAVKSRHDQVIPTTPSNSSVSSSSSQRCCVVSYQSNCILIRRAEILGEEPYVIACRLFFWRDLKHASQLKRLPVCPNERDPVYVCCNPLHWCRVLETETAPPPYQMMNQIAGLNPPSAVSLASSGSTDLDSMRQMNCSVRGQATESQTTDGEGRCFSQNWCEVAYWELAQRVGDRFPAFTPTINIFSDRPYTITGDEKDGMYLKELIAKRATPSPEDVQYTRQKIGLGITLSQEADGVWLYNRSTVPIFVYSPTLTESWYRVCRVEPGDCLRAFDKYRAQTLVHPGQLPGVQTGPIDKYSMRISFGKGWGCSYKRPDVTLCPCWLEVLFKPQR